MFPETINCSDLTKRLLSFIPIENGPSVFVSAAKFPLKSQPFVVSTFTGYSTIAFHYEDVLDEIVTYEEQL